MTSGAGAQRWLGSMKNIGALRAGVTGGRRNGGGGAYGVAGKIAGQTASGAGRKWR